MKKNIILLSIFLITALSLIAIFLYMYFEVNLNKYENEWNIELPNKYDLKYKINNTAIDGYINYYVLDIKEDIDASLFINDNNSITKLDFQNSLNKALKSIPHKDGNIDIPRAYQIDNESDFEYLLLDKLTTLRFKYLFLIYYKSENRLILIDFVSQVPIN
ncbi:hypothetical protein [Acholeplasma granularum]|uniref:hypothetical protein n=1 Tax=Acholeplasma granularum TaxID=264635 RepID=UPI0004B1237E|nr:hypothetical protein [Acholeplasma granularum]